MAQEIKTYRDLEVWQKSVDLVVCTYEFTRGSPQGKRFGLTSQIQRSAVSVPANVAEGHARLHRGDYIHHLSIARGSLAEYETLLTIAVRLELLSRDRAKGAWKLCQQIGKMLNTLIRNLRAPQSRAPDPRSPDPAPDPRSPAPDPRSPAPAPHEENAE